MLEQQCHGHADRIINGTVTGWAVDAVGNKPASLFVFIDGKAVGNFPCTDDRPDVTEFGLDGQSAGFTYAIPDVFLDGKSHEIAIRFPNGLFLQFANDGGTFADRGWFQFERPVAAFGVVDGFSNGALNGWAVTEDHSTGRRIGGANVIVKCNGVEAGRAKAGKYRPDVSKSLDCDPYCGFSFTPPVRYRDGGEYVFRFYFPNGAELAHSPLTFAYPCQTATAKFAKLQTALEAMSAELWQVKRDLRDLLNGNVFTLADYDSWARQYQRALRSRIRQTVGTSDTQPLVSILCPVYRPRIADFTAAVESVLAQTYTNWELILVDDNSRSKELSTCLKAFGARDSRIRIITHQRNSGISAATNAAIKAAKGDYIALFDHDDLLVDIALAMMVDAALRTGAKLLYSDEDKIDDYGRFSEPNFKPDWNYRFLLAQNYVCHFLMVESATLRQAGPLDSKYDGAQDHDLILRLAEIVPEPQIFHVPEVIYHWRRTPGSTASAISTKSYAIEAGVAAVRDHLKRRGFDAAVSAVAGRTTYKVDWRCRKEPKVCVIVPYREQIDLTRECLDSLLTNTGYQNFEVLLVDNWSVSDEAAAFRAAAAAKKKTKVLCVDEPFNYSRINNLACRESDAEFFVFMNNDVFVTQRDWLRLLVNEAQADPKVAAVGAKLLFPEGTIQHGGVILGAGGVGDHAWRGLANDDPGVLGRASCAQELSAVTAALMLCRADAFRAAGGFDEKDLAVAYNDVDLCLKLRKLCYRVIWTPDVVAEHRESVSRGHDFEAVHLGRFVFEERTMLSRWGDVIASDPFYSRHFSQNGGIFSELSPYSLDMNRTDFDGNAKEFARQVAQ